MNRTILTGRATKEMELIGRERNVGKVSIAVNGLKPEETSFIPITCFGRTAENGAKYIYKGMLIAVDGKLYQNTYEKDGKKYSSIEVIADRIEYLDKIKTQEEQPPIEPLEFSTKTTTQETIEYEDSDLPW